MTMKKYYFLLLFGLFLIFWAISFYYYNPTFIDPTFQYKKQYGSMLPPELKAQISIIFFWGFLIVGLSLTIIGVIGIYKSMFGKRR